MTVVVFIDFVLTYVLDTKNAHSTCKQTNTNMIFILSHALKSLRHVFLSFSKVVNIISHIKLTTVRKIKKTSLTHCHFFKANTLSHKSVFQTIFKNYPPHNSNSSVCHTNTGYKEEIFLNVCIFLFLYHHNMRSVRF